MVFVHFIKMFIKKKLVLRLKIYKILKRYKNYVYRSGPWQSPTFTWALYCSDLMAIYSFIWFGWCGKYLWSIDSFLHYFLSIYEESHNNNNDDTR